MKEIRRFGFSLSLGLNILGCIMFYRETPYFIWFILIGSLTLVSAIIYPKAVVPVKKVLDFLILGAGHLINAITLMTVFYLIVTPIGILFRMFGKDILDLKIDRSAESYWIERKDKPFSLESYRRLS